MAQIANIKNKLQRVGEIKLTALPSLTNTNISYMFDLSNVRRHMELNTVKDTDSGHVVEAGHHSECVVHTGV